MVRPAWRAWCAGALPRGDSLDAPRLRARTWRVVGGWLVRGRGGWWGAGRGACGRDLRRHRSCTGQAVLTDHAFCEPLELVYEHGLLAVLGLAAWLWLAWPRPGDPWSTALVVYWLAGCGSISWRTGPFPWLGAALTLGRWLG